MLEKLKSHELGSLCLRHFKNKAIVFDNLIVFLIFFIFEIFSYIHNAYLTNGLLVTLKPLPDINTLLEFAILENVLHF